MISSRAKINIIKNILLIEKVGGANEKTTLSAELLELSNGKFY